MLVAIAVALLLLHQHLIDLAALAQHGVERHARGLRPLGPSFYLGLPFRVVDPPFGPPQSIHFVLIAVGALEALTLFALYRSLRERAAVVTERAALVVGALAMLAIALNARTVLGFDLYSYAGYAKLGVPSAYAGPAQPFAGDFRAINDDWGTPIIACPYGPLWVVLAQFAAGGAKTLASALFALRLLALVPFIAIAVLLARRFGTAIAALFALNPALYVLYIANGHNDIIALAPVLLAFGLVATAPLAAALLVAAAGLVKLPFAGCALLVFAGPGALARRTAWAALSIAIVAAASVVWGGMDYVHYLVFRLHDVHAPGGLSSLTASAIRTALFALAVFGALAAFTRGIVWRAVSWSLVASSSTVYPWYLATCIPYAVLERGALAAFLILLPLTAALFENAFPHFGLGQFTMLVVLGAGLYEIVRRRQRPIGTAVTQPRGA